MKFEGEKFYPGPRIEPGPLALRAGALITELSRTRPTNDRIFPLILIPSGLRTDNLCRIKS